MRVLALLILLSLFLPFSRAEAACGKFLVVKGNVQVDFAKDKRSDKARVGTEVCAGDSISAGPDSRAKIKMVDNNELNISPETVMKIATYDYKPEENKKKVLLDVLKGKVRSTVKQKYDGQASTYQVKTKAAVAGVRGTDFIASFDPKMGRLEVVTFEGRVEVGNMGKDGRVIPDVAVTAGQMTEVLMGKTAEPPKAVPASELKQMDSSSQAATPSPRASDRVADTPPRAGDKEVVVGDKGEPLPPPPPTSDPLSVGDGQREPASPGPIMMPLDPLPPPDQIMRDIASDFTKEPLPPMPASTPAPMPTPPPPPPIMQQPGNTNLNVIITY